MKKFWIADFELRIMVAMIKVYSKIASGNPQSPIRNPQSNTNV